MPHCKERELVIQFREGAERRSTYMPVSFKEKVFVGLELILIALLVCAPVCVFVCV